MFCAGFCQCQDAEGYPYYGPNGMAASEAGKQFRVMVVGLKYAYVCMGKQLGTS